MTAIRTSKTAAAKAERLRRERKRESLFALCERWIGAPVPRHAQRGVEIVERAIVDGRGRIVVDAPPGFAKSTLFGKAPLVWAFQRDATHTGMYASYADRLARHHSRDVRDATEAVAGVEMDPSATSDGLWRTAAGGFCLATSIGGAAATGFRVKHLVVDDSLSGRAAAESAVTREASIAWHTSTGRTRVEPPGIVIAPGTRWHVADLPAFLIEHGYEHVSIPALDASGESMWPERFAASELRAIEEEIGPRDWNALYMGAPTVAGSRLFDGTHLVDRKDVPTNLRLSIGIDCSYGGADWSVAVVLGASTNGRLYVVDVVRVQARIEAFAAELVTLSTKWNAPPIHWHVSGQEEIAADVLRRETKLSIQTHRATATKIARATPLSIRWNRGEVLTVQGAPWSDAYARELCDFGPGARRDDQVDASSSAYAGLTASRQWTEIRIPPPVTAYSGTRPVGAYGGSVWGGSRQSAYGSPDRDPHTDPFARKFGGNQ